MAKLKIQTATGSSTQRDAYVSPIQINGTNIGGTGGDTALSVPTIRIQYLRDSTGAVENGFIVFQKGARKFEVNNTSNANVTVVSLVNRSNAAAEITSANTGAIRVNVAVITGANLANIGTGGGGYTNARTFAYLTFTAANVAGYATPVVGYQLTGNSGFLTSNISGNVQVVAINSATNVTISCPDQTINSNNTGRIQVTETFNAKRISNKYVWDWSDRKWRFYLGTPYTDGSSTLSSQPTWQGVNLVRVDNA
jgi:hypothetical protein